MAFVVGWKNINAKVAKKKKVAKEPETAFLPLGLIRNPPYGLIQNPPKGRMRRYRSGKEQRNGEARKISACYSEPWLLTCDRPLDHLSAQSIVKLYSQRMRIEQQFRDTKNMALGMGLSDSRSAGATRLQTLLLIAHIAQLALRLIGEAAKVPAAGASVDEHRAQGSR